MSAKQVADFFNHFRGFIRGRNMYYVEENIVGTPESQLYSQFPVISSPSLYIVSWCCLGFLHSQVKPLTASSRLSFSELLGPQPVWGLSLVKVLPLAPLQSEL